MAERYSGGFGGTLQREVLAVIGEGQTPPSWVDAGVDPINLEDRIMDPNDSSSFDSLKTSRDQDKRINAFLGWTRPHLLESKSTVSQGAGPASEGYSPPGHPSVEQWSPQTAGAGPQARQSTAYNMQYSIPPDLLIQGGGPTTQHIDSSVLPPGSRLRRNWRKTRRRTANEDGSSSSGSDDDDFGGAAGGGKPYPSAPGQYPQLVQVQVPLNPQYPSRGQQQQARQQAPVQQQQIPQARQYRMPAVQEHQSRSSTSRNI